MARKIALLIGVGEYGEGLKSLRCPVNGVKAMQSILGNPKIGGFDQVVPLVNPDVGTMRARMGEIFAPLTKHDLGLFYFTGHGIKDMTGDFYLTTAHTQLFENGRPNPGTAVEADFLKRVMGNCSATRKVIILDCCFGAAIADGFLGMADNSIDVKAQMGGEGWCVLTASTSTRYALEQAGEELSVYTRYLVEGLKTGGAAPEGQEGISIGHLHEYVRTQVKAAAPAMEPAIFNAQQGYEIVIAKAQVDNEQRYRKQAQQKIRNGKIRPAARKFLEQWQQQLGLSAEQVEAIEDELLKPYREKQKHLKVYVEALEAEKAECYPLDKEAIQDLKDLQRLLNLRDADVQAEEQRVLGEQIPSQPQAQMRSPATQAAGKAQTKVLQYPTFSFETVRVNEQGKVIETLSGEAEYFSEDLGKGVTLEMVRIPGGKFLMGAAAGEEGASNDEYPQHEVNVPEFWLGKYAVTQAQWKAVVALPKVERDLKADPAHFKGAQRPVEQVSWQAVVEFCQRLSRHVGRDYQLPSEAQWEYACRAGTTTPFYFGATITPDLVNYNGNSTYASAPKGKYREETTEVGSFSPNVFGLYDMHGNMWEWCLDGWHASYEGAPSDGAEWKSSGNSKMLRGGSWPDYPRDCRSAGRGRSGLDIRNSQVGFRVACFSPGIK